MVPSNNNKKRIDRNRRLKKDINEIGRVGKKINKGNCKEKYGKRWWIYYYNLDRYFFSLSLLFLLGIIFAFIMKGLTYLWDHPGEIWKPLIPLATTELARRIMKNRK